MTQRPLGIVMGHGDLPVCVVEFCHAQKRPYVLFAVQGNADPSFIEKHPYEWISFGQISHNLDLFRKHNIQDIVFVGNVTRPSLFSLNLDWLGIRWLLSIGWKALGDDGLLSGVVRLLEKEGFTVVGAHQLVEELLMPAGPLGKIKPSKEELASIKVGVQAAKELGQQDIGQGVIVSHDSILARETSEGTDSMLQETAPLLAEGRPALLVKVSKPQQEKRVDLPTIGPDTIKNLAHYGYKGVALEAGNGIILHPEQVIKMADQKGIFVYGVNSKKI